MARVSFIGVDGEEHNMPLDSARTLSIGRDPGNDLVLRDPRVSRRHAEIVFDKGFFVLRDLSSANGTFVNGKKINVAPLVDRAQIKLGNSRGTFFREVDKPDTQPSSLSVDLFKATESGGHAERAILEAEAEPDPFPQASNLPATQVLHTTEIVSPPAPMPDQTEAVPMATQSSTQASAIPADPRFQLSRYVLDTSVPYGEQSTVRDESGNPLFHYRRPVNLAGFLAGLFAALVTLAGIGVTIFLAVSGFYLQAFFASLLTVAFVLVILLLIPRRRQIYLYDDAEMTSVNLMLWQESRFTFPVLRFSLRTEDGRLIGSFSKSFLSLFGRHRWMIGDALGSSTIGCAVEDSLGTALLRKFLGSFFGLFKTNFRILIGSEQIGVIDRRTSGLDRYFLDLTPDASIGFDRRAALGLAILIDGLERK